MSPKKKTGTDVERDKYVFHTAGLANVKKCQVCLTKLRQLSLYFLTMTKTEALKFIAYFLPQKGIK
jgi:hypothetical protein